MRSNSYATVAEDLLAQGFDSRLLISLPEIIKPKGIKSVIPNIFFRHYVMRRKMILSSGIIFSVELLPFQDVRASSHNSCAYTSIEKVGKEAKIFIDAVKLRNEVLTPNELFEYLWFLIIFELSNIESHMKFQQLVELAREKKIDRESFIHNSISIEIDGLINSCSEHYEICLKAENMYSQKFEYISKRYSSLSGKPKCQVIDIYMKSSFYDAHAERFRREVQNSLMN